MTGAGIMYPMLGGGSIQLVRVLGIRVGVHPTWFLMLFVVIWLLTGLYEDVVGGDQAFVLATLSAFLFFGSVVLHELGHAVVARRNGIDILGIDLWLLGGLARMSRDTDSPGVEFRVAAAGPLVTLLIALACFGAGTLLVGAGDTVDAGLLDPLNDNEALAVLGYLSFVNALLLVFNLIPAFPLDGGRIARAAAWKLSGDRARATRLAATLGRGFSFALVGVGIFLVFQGAAISGVWLAFVGFTLGQAARAALFQARVTSRIEGVRVADVMDSEPVYVRTDATVDRAYEECFLRYGYPWFPVVDRERRLVGLVTRASIDALTDEERRERTVASVMAGDPGSALRVDADEPLEALLGRDGLRRLGAVMAVDSDGRLRGIVTEDQLRSALSSPAPV